MISSLASARMAEPLLQRRTLAGGADRSQREDRYDSCTAWLINMETTPFSVCCRVAQSKPVIEQRSLRLLAVGTDVDRHAAPSIAAR